MRILIVEDESLTAATMELALTDTGHEVIGSANSVQRAMDMARRLAPDLALVDIELGIGGSGIAAARGMKKHLGLLSLFTTAHADRAREACDAALGVLHKPFDAQALNLAVDTIERMRTGKSPGTLPPGLELFPTQKPALPVRP